MSSTIIFDNGTESIKTGFAGSFAPCYSIESIIGRNYLSNTRIQTYRGKKDLSKMPSSGKVNSIFENDYSIVDLNGLESLYKYLLYEKLQISDKDLENDTKYMIVSKPYLSNKYKSKISQILFESLNANGMYFADSTTMGLYSYGKTSGVVLELGYKTSIANCVYEGYNMPLTLQKSNYGSCQINEILSELIKERNSKVLSNYKISSEIIDGIKKELCYISSDYYDELVLQEDDKALINYTLPDGKLIIIGHERFQAPQLLFDPKFISGNRILEESIATLVTNSIHKSSRNFHKLMYNNVVLIGGNSMLLGLKDRLYKGLTHLAPASININVNTSPQRNYATFTGASLLAQQNQMKHVWITKQDVQEYGHEVIQVRCF